MSMEYTKDKGRSQEHPKQKLALRWQGCGEQETNDTALIKELESLAERKPQPKRMEYKQKINRPRNLEEHRSPRGLLSRDLSQLSG
ncbi:hypothetical protein RRG08_023425 [Elysia crispata]|uniref:Uncharacterized protein n=1 Tax=Elysia crispata TaxID=231223 RepID=A0AAE0YEA6_9GAST|nr:hypothetical protein RRG08_023425 [Elysia crispata]